MGGALQVRIFGSAWRASSSCCATRSEGSTSSGTAVHCMSFSASERSGSSDSLRTTSEMHDSKAALVSGLQVDRSCIVKESAPSQRWASSRRVGAEAALATSARSLLGLERAGSGSSTLIVASFHGRGDCRGRGRRAGVTGVLWRACMRCACAVRPCTTSLRHERGPLWAQAAGCAACESGWSRVREQEDPRALRGRRPLPATYRRMCARAIVGLRGERGRALEPRLQRDAVLAILQSLRTVSRAR